MVDLVSAFHDRRSLLRRSSSSQGLRRLASVVLAVGSVLWIDALRGVALAQESSAAPAKKELIGSPMDFWTLLVKGGWFMIPIAALSVLVVTICFDRLIGLRTNRMFPRRFRRSLAQLLRNPDTIDPRAIYKLTIEHPSVAARIVRAVVLKTGRPTSELQAALQEATQRETDRAYANVRWLTLASGVAPLLGLLGTVWGLIRAFHDTAQMTVGQNRANGLAVGIYEALVGTLGGLMVAIPAAFAAHFFEGRVTSIMGRIEEMIGEILPRLERYEGKVRFETIGRELAPRDISGAVNPSSVSGSSLSGELKIRPTTQARVTK